MVKGFFFKSILLYLKQGSVNSFKYYNSTNDSLKINLKNWKQLHIKHIKDKSHLEYYFAKIFLLFKVFAVYCFFLMKSYFFTKNRKLAYYVINNFLNFYNIRTELFFNKIKNQTLLRIFLFRFSHAQ